MRPALAALVVVLAVGAAAQSPAPGEQVVGVEDFSKCGLQTKLSPNKLPDPACFQFVENAVIDQDGSLLRRNGYQPYNSSASTGTQALRGLWAFTDANGSAYLIAQTSASMVSSLGNGAFTAINGLNGGLSMTAQMSCVQCLGALYCFDGVDTPFSIGTALSTTSLVQAPVGKYAGCFRNRVLTSGVSGTQTDLYLSGQVNGTDWTIPTTVTYSTSPAIINVAGINDGFPVKCLMGEFQNTYLIGRDYDVYGLTGNDLRDFTLRKVDGQIGCMDNNSPEVVNNALMWLSHRGVELLAGPQIAWASQPIDPTLKVIINAAGNSQSSTINNSNFTQGNLTVSGPGSSISSTIFPGNLVPSTFGFTSAGINVNTWEMVDVDTTVNVSGTLSNQDGSGIDSLWTVRCGTVTNVGHALTGNSGNVLCTFGSNDEVSTNVNSSTGIWSFNFISTAPAATPSSFEFWFYSTGTLLTASATNAYALRVSNTNNLGPAQNSFMDLIFISTAGNGFTYLSSNGTNLYDGNTHLFRITRSTQGYMEIYDDSVRLMTATDTQMPSPNSYTALKFNTNGSQQHVSRFRLPNFYKNQESTSYYTGISTNVWGTYQVSLTSSSSSSVTFNAQVATAATGPYSSFFSVTPQVQITPVSSTMSYIRHQIVMNAPSAPPIATVTSVSLSAETTGYYISPCVTVSTPTSWGNLTVNAVTNGGSFSFWMSTGATCGIATSTNANWASQTANSVITVTTATANVAIRVLFSLDVATEVPTLNNMVVNWNAGSSRPNVASAQYQNKYFLFYTTSQAVGATNDHAVVFDQNGRWQLMDSLPASSAALYLNQLYLGDSNATGTAYLFDTGSSGNGAAYNFAFTTPDLDGGDPISQKNWSRAYLELGAPNTITAGTTLSCTYTLDGSTETFTLGTVALSEAPTQSGYFVAKLPFPLASPTASRWVNLSCTNTGTNGPIRVYGYRIIFTPQSWP